MGTLNTICRIGVTVAILLTPSNVFSQNTTETPSIINYSEWSGANVDSLYENCIIALHLNNMELDIAKTIYGKEIKMIYTEVISRQHLGYVRISFSLSLLLFKVPDNKIALHINMKNLNLVSENSTPIRQIQTDLCKREIARIMKELFDQINNLQGKPISTKQTGITI